MPAFLPHGIVHQRDLPSLARIMASGQSGRLEVLPFSEMAAVLSRFEGEAQAIAEAFGSSTDIATLAIEHHRVLAEIAARVDVVPMRMRALLPDIASLAGSIEGHAGDFRRLLTVLGGQVELAVTLRPAARPVPLPGPAPTNGRGYLRQRKAVKDDKRHGTLRLEEAMALVETALAPWISRACDVVVPLHGANPTRRDRALLVARESLDAIADHLPAIAERLSEAGVTLDVSGPWAPFHFLEAEAKHG